MPKLNTKRLLKELKRDQCRTMSQADGPLAALAGGEAQFLAIKEEESILNDTSSVPENAVALERELTHFLSVLRDASSRHKRAAEAEQFYSDHLQDYLHTFEFNPELLDSSTIIPSLHKARVERRLAKRELEVAEIFAKWATTHDSAIKQLEQTLGQIRKALQAQSLSYYVFKTSEIGEKGQQLAISRLTPPMAPASEPAAPRASNTEE